MFPLCYKIIQYVKCLEVLLDKLKIKFESLSETQIAYGGLNIDYHYLLPVTDSVGLK